MQIIKFRRIENDYSMLGASDYVITILGMFLDSDVRSMSLSWIESIKNIKAPLCISSNATALCRDIDDPEIIELGAEWELDGPYFRIKEQELIRLLVTWGKLYEQQPRYIIITIDGDDIRMEGKDTYEFTYGFVKFIKRGKEYVFTDFDQPIGWTLGYSLYWYIAKNTSEWIKWLNGPEKHRIVDPEKYKINVFKISDNEVQFGALRAEDGPNFIIKKDQLIAALKKWDEVNKIKPPAIMVKVDHGNISIEPTHAQTLYENLEGAQS